MRRAVLGNTQLAPRHLQGLILSLFAPPAPSITPIANPRSLWDAAARTAHSLPARLAIEHCCHEARGLDVLPGTIRKFAAAGDAATAALLEGVVYREEVAHCAAGVRWLRHLHAAARALAAAGGGGGSGDGGDCGGSNEAAAAAAATAAEGAAAAAPAPLPAWAREALRYATPRDWFHSLVLQHYGPLKGPFNSEARAAAGFEPDWYEPLERGRHGGGDRGTGGGGGANGSGGAGEGAGGGLRQRREAAAAAACGGEV